MLTEKHKIEKEQNVHLQNQVAQLLQVEQDQKLQIEQRDSSIQMLQVGPISCISFLYSAFPASFSASNLSILECEAFVCIFSASTMPFSKEDEILNIPYIC